MLIRSYRRVEKRWEASFLISRRLQGEQRKENWTESLRQEVTVGALGRTRRQNIHSCQRRMQPVGYRNQVRARQWFRNQAVRKQEEKFQWIDWKYGKSWPGVWLQHHPLPTVVWVLGTVWTFTLNRDTHACMCIMYIRHTSPAKAGSGILDQIPDWRGHYGTEEKVLHLGHYQKQLEA